MGTNFRDVVPWPAEPVGHGFVAGEAAGAEGTSGSPSGPVGHAADEEYGGFTTEGLDALGALMEWRVDTPRVQRLRASIGEVLDVESDPQDATALVEGVAYLDLRRTAWARVRLTSGTLQLEPRPEGLDVSVTLAATDSIGRFWLSVPAVDAWCALLGDTWLTREVSAHALFSHDPWELACAAGMVVTLAEPPIASPASSAAEALAERHDLLQAIDAARHWCRGWSDEEFATVRDLAIVSVEQLDARLRDLAETADPAEGRNAAWLDDFVRFCHLRDDLCGVMVLMDWSRDDPFAIEAVAAVDRRAERFVQMLDREGPIEDERLRRVWLGRPDAWWGWPASLEDPDESADAGPG